MSRLGYDLREMRSGLTSRVRRWRAMLARATAGPLLVRLGVWLTGVVAMLLAYPVEVMFDRPGLVLVAIAALPALAPRTMIVTAVLLVMAGGWVGTSLLAGTNGPLWQLVALAASLYLVHNGASLAAQLTYDAIVAPGVLARWFARSGLVILATALLGVYLFVVDVLLANATESLIATSIGIFIAVGVAYVLRRQFGGQAGEPVD